MQPEKEVKIRANVSAKWHDVFSTLCPPRCLTTQVNCADRPAATVMFSKGEIKPGSKPVTEKKTDVSLTFLLVSFCRKVARLLTGAW